MEDLRTEITALLAQYDVDAAKFADGNRAAGGRARKTILEVSKVAAQLRRSLLAFDDERQAKRLS